MTIKEQLQAPFSPDDIEWRIQQKDKNNEWALVLAYVTNRAIQNRLDDVFDVGGWQNEYKEAPDGGVMCGISAHVGDQWVTKWDGAENTEIEKVKGGLSNAMKRAAVQWGIGRYLYNLEATFVKPTQLKPPNMKGYQQYYDKDTKKRYYWKIPELPVWATPNGSDTSES